MSHKRLFTLLLLPLILLIAPCNLSARSLSPFNYGYAQAKSGAERYEVLYKTHCEAVKRGMDVDYTGIERVDLVIPAAAKSIPLTIHTDFKNAVFHVVNKQKELFLFSMIGKAEPLEIDMSRLARSKQYLPELGGRSVLLSIEDGNPWVENRKGYNYGATRRDVIVVKNGWMKNMPVMPYDNAASVPVCSWYHLDTTRKVFKNISFIRSDDSKYKTYLVKFEGQYNVFISNVDIKTPASGMNGDRAIKIVNCSKVRFQDVMIDGTYSQEKKYGYGIGMNNVYDVSFKRLTAHGSWGVFGNNNIQKVLLEDCDINRYDIHCYGRDVTCKNCTFRNLYNQFSSVYGTVRFTKCKFLDFIPVVIEYSYNAYTGFNLVFQDCFFKVSERGGKNCIVSVGYLDDEVNSRPELAEKCWPNVKINGMEIQLPSMVDNVYLMRLREKVKYTQPLGYTTAFVLNNVRFTTNSFRLSTPELILTNFELPIRTTIRVSQKNATKSAVHIIDNISKHEKRCYERC